MQDDESRLNQFYRLRREADEALIKVSDTIAKLQSLGHEACMTYAPNTQEGAGSLTFFSRYRNADPTKDQLCPQNTANAPTSLIQSS